MENATQALLIAAGVLIGIVILGLGIHLFNTFGHFSADTQSQMEQNEIAQFNDQFLKYSGLTDLTIQEVVTVKNYALESNKEYMSYNPSQDRAGQNNDYIDVYLNNTLILEQKDEDLLKKEMESGKKSNRFTCKVEFNTNTDRVNKIYFFETP